MKGGRLGNYLICNLGLQSSTLLVHMIVMSYVQVLYTDFRVVWTLLYFCLTLTWGKFSCYIVSMIASPSIILGSFMYLPLLSKTWSSGIELIMWSDGTTVCASQTFTFLYVNVGFSSCFPMKKCVFLNHRTNLFRETSFRQVTPGFIRS